MTNTTTTKPGNSKAIEKHGPRYAIASFTARVRGEVGCSVLNSMQSAKEQADCYLASRPAGTVDVDYSEQCGRCRGAGRLVRGKRRRSFVRCPACKGSPELIHEVRIASFVGSDRA